MVACLQNKKTAHQRQMLVPFCVRSNRPLTTYMHGVLMQQPGLDLPVAKTVPVRLDVIVALTLNLALWGTALLGALVLWF